MESNTSSYQKYLAFLKYRGKLVEEGFLDARKSAEVLLGFDEIIKYFVQLENPEFYNIEFEVPVRIQKGTWEALIPDDIELFLVKGILAWGVAKYFGSALNEMAKNDFKDIGFKNIIKGAFRSITWVIKIGKHFKRMNKRKLENLKFEQNNEIIGIPDENNNYLYVPKKYLEYYTNCPEKLFSKIARIIEPERELIIGLLDEVDSQVDIDHNHKFIFIKQEDIQDIIFPELKHNDYVELEGHVTKGNEKSNTIGFEYNGHILSCKPYKGKVIKFKEEMYSNCKIKGYIDRIDKFGNPTEKKPKIIFVDLILTNENNSKSYSLF
ncbi:MAG: hypothetical protein ACFFDN_21905 [Candidatus Hodarchaeota archaeon]